MRHGVIHPEKVSPYSFPHKIVNFPNAVPSLADVTCDSPLNIAPTDEKHPVLTTVAMDH
ncbi:hypothetical protein [Chitinophaga agri]|uniref:Uncharacterized protein n=1 Tax=Chitinophaga agri TaxID=2703787 RepID=A0A6B9ZC19_9BACT|nr:hypothetical protein [Chitinophaga agri]QHS59707.1 hypothetical protein GWR21_08915 [Chitinophaga agri]